MEESTEQTKLWDDDVGAVDIKLDDEFAKASKKGAFFNISNCAVGAGILSLPYAFETMGLVQALVIFTVFAFVTCLTLQVLPLCAKAAGVTSYEDMVEVAFGGLVAKLFQVIIILYSFGVIIGYIVIIGDLIPPLIATWAGAEYPNDHWYFSKPFYQVSITLVILLPLSCLKRLDSLKFASIFAITSVVYFTILVVVESAIDLSNYLDTKTVVATGETIVESVVWWNWSTEIFLGIPIMAFAFGGHLQAISIYSELHTSHRTLQNWNIISVGAVFFLSVIYVIVGALSYLRFLPGEDGNVLEQMLSNEIDNVAVQIASLAMSTVVILSFPLFTWPIRFSMDRLFFYKLVSIYDPSPASKSLSVQLRYYGITLFIIGISLLLATIADSLEVVFGLTGASGGVLIKFVFPVLCYWKLGPVYRKKFTDKPEKLPIWQKIGLIVVLVVSVFAGVISSITVLVDAWRSLQDS